VTSSKTIDAQHGGRDHGRITYRRARSLAADAASSDPGRLLNEAVAGGLLDQQQDHPGRYRDLPRAEEARGQPE
jgi:hypothetical protein